MYGRIGTTTVAHGTVTSWLVDVLNVLTGNLDRPGGAMFPLPAHSRRGTGSGPGFAIGRWHSRVRGLPEVLGELPAVTLADEIETPGDGPGPGADHRRRQPGAVRAQRRPARPRRSPGWTSW